ncbi:MAG: FAD-linked oxidase C-terminal domain-containing protein [Gammaproteobacteria bacterium]
MGPESINAGDSPLAVQLRRELEGETLFDAFSRGRYSTDASMYQIEPIGVVVPRHKQDVLCAIQIAAEHGVPLLPRGGGTSQAGQTVGRALVIDSSKYLTAVSVFEPGARTVSVEPGIVLDTLNDFLAPHGLFFPVDVSTSSRATLGGMAGNNSVGARSLHYGHMVDNVLGIHAILGDGEQLHLQANGSSPVGARSGQESDGDRLSRIADQMHRLYERNADEIVRRYPQVARNVAGYNIDRLGHADVNLADLLIGSEGTLAWFQQIDLALQPIPAHKVLGVCHFPTFFAAMESAQHIVALDPAAAELLDRTVLDLAADIPAFSSSMSSFIIGRPAAVLLVEFAGDDRDEQLRKLDRLEEVMGDLGFPDGVLRAVDGALQESVWSLRKAALNIVMSMKGDGKPISFVEDCAVPLDKLGEYTYRLTEVFERHGTTGTWYAHAGVGCLHVRPILNLKQDSDLAKLRSISDEAHALVREYKGSHSGEHGDGLVRSEFLEPILGSQIVAAFREVKQSFDPDGLFNPGKIVDPPRMDQRSLTRFPERYQPQQRDDALDWSAWGGFHRATEMCNNNGACRKTDAGVMCPSYRVTRDEQHVTRGRANSLRLALTGQLAPDALTSKEMYETMDLCVGCKACKRECPTGVDLYRMKIEFLNHYRARWGLTWRDRLIAYLPRYAPWAARLSLLANASNQGRLLPQLRERLLGFTAKRRMPVWRRDIFRGVGSVGGVGEHRPEVVLLVDTFNTYFEPETATAAVNVLTAAGYAVVTPQAIDRHRPLCCGRTFLNTGLIDEAKVEARRVLATLAPYVERGVPIVGLEPSCLLTLRDEFIALLPGEATAALANSAMLFEEFLSAERKSGRLKLSLNPLRQRRVLLHGHCHQKAFGLMASVEEVLRWIPELDVERVDSGCCGLAGSFGYEAEHYETSMKMAELSLLPAVRRADEQTLIVADGTSCRHQIHDGAGRAGLHVARVLELALKNS